MSALHTSAAFYTRTSCLPPTGQRRLESQLDELRSVARADGVEVPPELVFIDDGFSGADRLRPALNRLRDSAATGDWDRLYVPGPDLLARDSSHQILLIDELRHDGVEIVLLNHDDHHRFLPRRADS